MNNYIKLCQKNSRRICIVIIDYFEVFMERPKALMARAQTWSNYKHHNMVKFFIVIAPLLNYIHFKGLGWPCLGSISNRKVLYFGSSFTGRPYFGRSHEAAGLYCAKVKLPPFTKGKKQLNTQLDKARQLSRVRIHVERVIGLLRLKYKILRSTLPINLIMSTIQMNIIL